MDVAREGKQADRVVLANGSDPKDWKQDAYFIEIAKIEKDTLRLSVSYTGGCAEHAFRLVAWDYFSKSEALQAKLLLAHDANGDACKAIIKQALRFDISPLAAEYHRVYGPEPGTVWLRLRDFDIEYYV
jgi:predicted type IV restriction endonuclease